MVLKNIIYLYAIQLLRLGLPLALLSILTKTLAGPQYSVYIYTLACGAWLSIFVEYGFSISATRRIATSLEPHVTREVVLQTQAARWLLTCSTLLFLGWALFVSSVFADHPEWAVCGWLLGVMTGLTPTYYFQAKSQLRIVALMEVSGGVLTVTSVLSLIHSPGEFWRLCVVLVLVRLVIWQVLDRRMFREHNLRYREFLHAGSAVAALKDGWRIFLVQAAASLYTSFNVVLLGGVSTAHAVAVYGSCERLIRSGLTFVGQATAAIFPRLNALKSNEPHKLPRARRLALLAFIAGSTACVPLIWWIAPPISNLLFHDKLPELVTVLRIMAMVIPAIAISNVLAFHFLVVDRQEHILNWVVFAAVPISLAAGWLLAHEHGAAGMAVAWVAVEWLVCIALAAIIYLRQKRSQLIL